MFTFQKKITRHTKRQKAQSTVDCTSIRITIIYGRNVGITRLGIYIYIYIYLYLICLYGLHISICIYVWLLRFQSGHAMSIQHKVHWKLIPLLCLVRQNQGCSFWVLPQVQVWAK